MIISHNSPEYRRVHKGSRAARWNGAYYYSQEIVKYFIPHIKTDRHWITLKVGNKCMDHSIYFIHNNLNPERYSFLKHYKDVLLICGIPETCEKVKHLGKPIYLPLSVDVEEVKRYKRENREGIAYAGRRSKRKGIDMSGVYCIEGMKRSQFLRTMARYDKVYAVGRAAIEAKILGCEILPYDPRFPDPGIWQVLNSREAAKILQEKIKEYE